MARLLARAIGLFWTLTAAAVLAGATLVALVRLLLPELSTQREAIALWIGETVRRPVIMGAIEAEWQGWVPRISIDGMTIMDTAGQRELVRFARAFITIDPIGSIGSGTLKPSTLFVSGVALTLVRDRHGRFSVAGMPPPKSPIIKWLIEQDNFAVGQADLTVIDERAQTSFALRDVAVTVRNHDGHKTVSGAVDLPPALGGRLQFVLGADRSPLEDDWNGDIRIRLTDADSAFVTEQLAWSGPPPPAARLDLTAWTRWRQAQLMNADLLLAARGADATADEPAVLSARARLSRRERGWRLAIADLDLPEANAPAALTVAWHTRDGVLQALSGRGRHLPVLPLAVAAGGLAPLAAAQREALAEAAPDGVIKALDFAWSTAAKSSDKAEAPGYFVDAVCERLWLDATAASPALEALDFETRFSTAGGYLAAREEQFRLAHAQRLVAPLDIEGLNAVLLWSRPAGGALTARVASGSGRINGAVFDLRGILAAPFTTEAHVDLVLDVAHGDGPRLHELVPRNLMPAKGERWTRQVFEAGHIEDLRLLLRGPVAAFPFREGEGVFRADFAVRDARLKYSHRWPVATGVEGHVQVDGPTVKMDVDKGLVMGAALHDVEVELPDLFVRERRLLMSGGARGPGPSAAAIVMASPLRHGKAARLSEIDIGGEIDVQLDMDLALFPGGSKEVLGQARFAGNRIHARKQRIVLDDVHGAVSFTRGDWYGEGLTAVFDGTPVGLVLNGGLDDPNYDSEFRMTGTSPANVLVKYLQRYAPPVYHWLETNRSTDALTGELPWKAVLTIPVAEDDGVKRPQQLRLESSLRGLDVELPWPFGKRAGERKPLRIDIALLDGIADLTRVDFGDTLDAEIRAVRGPDGKARAARAEVVFGALAPRFERAPGFNLKGYIPRLPLGEWSAFLNRSERAATPAGRELPLGFDVQVSHLELLGQALSDVRLQGSRDDDEWHIDISSPGTNGKAVVPRDVQAGRLVLELDHLRLARATEREGSEPAAHLDPRRFPALDLRIDAFAYGDIDFGSAHITTARHADGTRLESLRFAGDGFELTANGDWFLIDGAQTSRFDIAVGSQSLANLLTRFGYNVANIEGGRTEIAINAHWPGTPADFALARMNGNFELHVADGRILDIDPGGGRLFGLLSLQSLPRRLSLDFDDIFGKGFAFDNIDGLFIIESGNAYTNSLFMDGPAARIDVTGRTGLSEQDYDQRVIVTPALSSSIPVAGALFGPIGVGAGAVYFLGQKMFKSIPEQIDKFLSREYAVTGSWADPSVERI